MTTENLIALGQLAVMIIQLILESEGNMSEVINYRGLLVGDERAKLRQVIAESDQREKEKAFLDELVRENKEAKAERDREAEEKRFYEVARRDFFEANPEANEKDFKRLMPKLRDELLMNNFRQQVGVSKEMKDFYDSLN